MADTTTQASGQNDGTSGADDQTATNTSGDAGGTTTDDGSGSGSVAYETHRRLLGEKKKVQEERDRLRDEIERRDAEAQAAEKKRLEEQGEYKKLLE